MVIYFFLRFENTVGDIACSHIDGMSDNIHHPVTAEVTGRSYFTGNEQDFVAIQSKIRIYVITQSESCFVTIAQVEFEAFVLHRTGIPPLTATFAKNSDVRGFNQNVCRFLVVVFGRAVQGLVEQAEIKTDVGLSGCFPFDVVVSYLSADKAGREQSAAVVAGNIIRSAVSGGITCAVFGFVDGIAGIVLNILITSLSPCGTNFQVVNYTSGLFHKCFFADTPSQGDGRESGVFIVATETRRAVTAERK